MSRIFFISILMFLLSACHTVEGIGKDLKKGGEAIEKSAR
jgi:predicted small secreted protein